MSIDVRYECAVCFGYASWVGDRARRNPLRAHLACKCEPEAEIRFGPDPEDIGDPFEKQRKAA